MSNTRRILLLILLSSVVMTCFPIRGEAEEINESKKTFDPSTGITTYKQRSYASTMGGTNELESEVPITEKSYISVSLTTRRSSSGSAVAKFIKKSKSTGARTNVLHIAGHKDATWSGDVDPTVYDYYIYTRAYAGWPAGHGSSSATVTIHPYFDLEISVINKDNYGKGEVNVYDVSNNKTLGSSSSDFSVKSKAGTSLCLEASPDEGYVFSEWSGDISGTSTTSSVFGN